ncbi:MAG: thiamine pyrophosphate-binding protein [Burkholderiales bacterium]|nr:thiamine pyrophosphate-binding protein [Burkholderiales bacterium]
MATMSGARAVLEALKANQVELVVGITGHTVMELADELARDGSIRTVPARTETNGTYMAYGYNKVRNAPRAACLWHVAGMTHAAPGVITAYADSVPLVVIGGNVTSDAVGKRDFQDTPSAEMYAPFSKWSHRVQRTADLAAAVNKAFLLAGSGRPRPVVLDVPFDRFVESAEFGPIRRIEPAAPPAGDPHAVARACELLAAAKRPVILAGGGVVTAGAGEELRALAEAACLPVSSGRSASKGVIAEDHPLALGTCGSFGWPIANEYLAQADCWCAIGCTFSQIAMQDWSLKSPESLIHVDIDPQEIGRIYPPALGIVGDARRVLAQMLERFRAGARVPDYRRHPRYPELKERKDRWIAKLDASTASAARPVDPLRLMREINAALPPEGIVTGGAGNNGEFAVHALKSYRPASFLLSQKYSAVGCSFPIALGAKLAAPERPVICIEGDGGLHYNVTELATAVMEKIAVVLVVMNDGHLNANRQIANALFAGKQVWTRLNNPDWVAVARSFGAEGERVEDPSGIAAALRRGLAAGMPYLIDLVVDPDVRCPITGKLWKIRW